MARRNSHIVWIVCASLAVAVLVGNGDVVVRLRPYWVAKYRGAGADLRGAVLIAAPLAEAQLFAADLRGANLRGANLRGADLRYACLNGATLAGADLRGVCFDDTPVGATFVDFLLFDKVTGRWRSVPPVTLMDVDLRGARYDKTTRWLAGFSPKRHGAMLVR